MQSHEEESLYSGVVHGGTQACMWESTSRGKRSGQGLVPASVADSLHCLALFWL